VALNCQRGVVRVIYFPSIHAVNVFVKRVIWENNYLEFSVTLLFCISRSAIELPLAQNHPFRPPHYVVCQGL
jgi:hypothetical protein